MAGRGGDAWSLARDALVADIGQGVAACVFLALAALAFVLVPRWTIPLGWTLVLLALLLGLFGPLFDLPEWMTNVSPFAQTPTVADGGIDLKGMWWLLVVGAVGTAGALALMRRRELHPAG